MTAVLETLLILALFAPNPLPQSESMAAAIEGTVTGDGAALLADVKISLDSITAARHFETLTDKSGHYLIENVPPGAYSVCAEAHARGCVVVPRVVMEPGKRLRLDFEVLRARKKLTSGPPAKKTQH